MSEYGRYMEANLLIEKNDGSDWTDAEVEDLVEKLVYDNMEHGLMVGGGIQPMRTRKDECDYCEDPGHKDISEEERCETCGGSGRKHEEEPTSDPEAEQEWKDIYAPIAQRTEQSPPKGKAEGSNPSRSANVRNRCDRESDGEPGDQGGQGDNSGVRDWCEDPGRDHSGENG